MKLDYLPVLQQQFNKEIILYNRIKRDKENVYGKKWYFPVHSAWGETSGAIAEEGAIPTPGTETTLESSGIVRTIFGKFEVSTKIIAATKNDRGAFVQAVDFKLKNVGDNLRKDINSMLNGDASGALAKVLSVSGQDITLDNTSAAGASGSYMIRVGQVLNAWTARSGGSQHNGDFTVSAVNYDTNVVTVVGTIAAVVATDYLFKSTGRGINVMGLLGIVDDGTFVTTFQNLSRTTYPFFKATALTASSDRDLTQVLIQQMEDKAYIKGGGKLSAYYSNLGQRSNYVQLVTAERRYVNTMKFDAGFDALEYNGKPWFVDRECVKNVIYGLDESVLRFFLLQDIDWMNDDGAVLARDATKLVYSATLQGHMEFGTYQPNRHVVLRNLNEPTGY